MTGAKWVSSMAIHPGKMNLFVFKSQMSHISYFDRWRQLDRRNIRPPTVVVRYGLANYSVPVVAPSRKRHPLRCFPQAVSFIRIWFRRLFSYCVARNGLQVRYKSAVSETSLLIFISHSSDLLKNPMIVPLKQLKGHEKMQDLGVLDVLFHPTQPWLLTTGADFTIRLYT